MTGTTTVVPAPAATKTPKGKKSAAGPKKTKAVATHPPVAQMVNAAIKALKERGGTSTQAIKKYISSTYKIDADKKSQFIRKYLKAAVTSGALVQTKGKGASGSFKLAVPGDKKLAAPKAKKTVATSKVSTTKTKSPVKKASVPKVKKTKKPPTAAKSPKPKVVKVKLAQTPKIKKPAAPKKAAPKKK